MRAAVLAALAGISVLGVCGALRPFPWRAADLVGTDSVVVPTRPGPAGARRVRSPEGPRLLTRSRRERDDEALARDLPLAADLLRLAVSSGRTVHEAVSLVAREGRGPVAAALARAVDGFERGGRLAEELERLPSSAGEALRPLTTTLVVALSSGAPVAPALANLSEAERRRVRRRTEQRVRRLPVLLLGPLVGLVLPAFVCLTVVPVGITAARVGLQPAPLDATDPLPTDPLPTDPSPNGPLPNDPPGSPP